MCTDVRNVMSPCTRVRHGLAWCVRYGHLVDRCLVVWLFGQVGKRARGFGMEIVYYSRSRKVEAEAALGGGDAGGGDRACVYAKTLADLLPRVDFLVLICPLTGK